MKIGGHYLNKPVNDGVACQRRHRGVVKIWEGGGALGSAHVPDTSPAVVTCSIVWYSERRSLIYHALSLSPTIVAGCDCRSSGQALGAPSKVGPLHTRMAGRNDGWTAVFARCLGGGRWDSGRCSLYSRTHPVWRGEARLESICDFQRGHDVHRIGLIRSSIKFQGSNGR